MLDYGSLSWNPNGQAIWRHVREVPCPGPYWSKRGCTGTREDEYGTHHHCPESSFGNGRKTIVRFIPMPQYDVTNRPRKGWKPKKAIIDRAFKS